MHRQEIEKYNDAKTEINYNVKVTINGKLTDITIMTVSFYKYLLWGIGKLEVKFHDDKSTWISTAATQFEKNINMNDLEILHENLLRLFENAENVKQIIGIVKNMIQTIGTVKSNTSSSTTQQLYISCIQEGLNVLFELQEFIEQIKGMQLSDKQCKLLFRNLIGYLFCSHAYIVGVSKETFCLLFPPMFDKAWDAGEYVEHLVEDTVTCCFGCCSSTKGGKKKKPKSDTKNKPKTKKNVKK
jgi:hypothetical protein